MGSPIQAKSAFVQQKGFEMSFELIDADTEAPIDNRYEAWGNEEKSTIYTDQVQLGLARHAKKIDVPMTEQFSTHDLRETLYSIQEQWWIEYGFDKWITNKMTGSDFEDDGSKDIGEAATANTNVMYGGDATGTGDIDTSDIIDLSLISKLKEGARMGIIGSSTKRKIFPIQTSTGGYYALVLHPYQVYDLKVTEGWQQAQREAALRGPENLIFSGTGNLAAQLPQAIGYWDGVLIYEYVNMPTISAAGSGGWGVGGEVAGATGLLLGSQAGLLAYCKGPEWIEETGYYSEYFGVMVRVLMGFDKATFNDIDNGCIAVKTAANYHYTNA
jgi:N4-gp56 family major capsid protein